MEQFNRTIRLLITDLARRLPKDPLVWRSKERVMLVCDLEPMAIISIAGAQLYKYREQVYARDEEFFTLRTFDDDLSTSPNAERAELTGLVIPKVKDVWGYLTAGEREEYLDMAVELLDSYVEYLSTKLQSTP